MMQDFTPKRRDAEPIEFTIEGEPFTFQPPKNAVFALGMLEVDPDKMEVTAMKDQLGWLYAGLPEEQCDRIKARLADPDDDFDIDLVFEIVKSLMAAASKRPTKQPSGS